MATRPNRQIGPGSSASDVGHERAEAHFLVAVVRHRPDDAGLSVRGVEIRRLPHAKLDAGVVHGAVDGRPALRPIALDDDRPVAAMDRLVAEIHVIFDRDEQRHEVGPGPSLVSHRRPAIEIERRAARRDRSVDHRRAADKTSPRRPQAAAPQGAGAVGVGEVPVELRYARGAAPMVLAAKGEQRRNRLLLREVGTGLEQQDPARGVFGQTRGDDAAARSRADNDDVILIHEPIPSGGLRPPQRVDIRRASSSEV